MLDSVYKNSQFTPTELERMNITSIATQPGPEPPPPPLPQPTTTTTTNTNTVGWVAQSV